MMEEKTVPFPKTIAYFLRNALSTQFNYKNTNMDLLFSSGRLGREKSLFALRG